MRVNLRSNLMLKIFSVLLALVCWYVVRHEETHLRDYTVPLEYVDLPDEMVLSGATVDRVNVRLRAAEAVFKTFSEGDIVARIDLARALLGQQYVSLTSMMIKAPPGTEVVRLEPVLVPLRIEKKLRRSIPVEAEFRGTPPRGYEKVRHLIDPPEVEIEGPASEVAQVSRALAGTIHLNGETSDYEITVTPVPDAPHDSRVRVRSPQGPVRVHVVIRPLAEGTGRPAGSEAPPIRPGGPRRGTQ